MATLHGKFAEELNKVNEALAAITSRLDKMESSLYDKTDDSEDETPDPAPKTKKKLIKEVRHRDFIIPRVINGVTFVLADHAKIATRVYALLDMLEENSFIFFNEHKWDCINEEVQDSDEIWLSRLVVAILEETNAKNNDGWPYRMFESGEDDTYAVCKCGTDYWFEV